MARKRSKTTGKPDVRDTVRVRKLVDAGHGNIKGLDMDNDRPVIFPTALQEIGPEQWNLLGTRVGELEDNPDYMIVESGAGRRRQQRHYVVGERAYDSGGWKIRSGASRYETGYIDILVLNMIARDHLRNGGGDDLDVHLITSYPPADAGAADALGSALRGTWTVTVMGRTLNISINQVDAFDEPMGAWGNVNISVANDGTLYFGDDALAYRSLVIDGGAGTINLMRINPGITPDYVSATSLPEGFNNVTYSLETRLREIYKDKLRDVRQLPLSDLHGALRNNVINISGRAVDVEYVVNEVLASYLRTLANAVQHRMGGAGIYNQIILSGGASAVVGERIKALLSHDNVVYAEQSPSKLIFANIRGGRLLWQLSHQ